MIFDVNFFVSNIFQQEVCKEEDHAVDDLYLELKDDFVCSFRRASLLMKFHMAVRINDSLENYVTCL